ncbi:MAG: glycosyltransferase family 4 protein, partial [Planctomycetes bacterium]|nr:glycosyltransferase family 4 protein [Planctomycetota bacterium]
MRLLVFTTLFPRPSSPHHGIFVLERLRHWRDATGGEAVVVAPVPFVPGALARGRFAEFADVPAEEQRDGFRVLHPRYLLLPKVSMTVAPWLLARAGVAAARRLAAAGERFDLVDAHYLYPDAVAAVAVARELALPLCVTARGTDVNLIPRHALPRRWLRWMLRNADAAIAVAEALRREVVALAPAGLECVTLRNGVDLEKFRPVERAAARTELGWERDGAIVVSVGHLIERKGHHHLIAALPQLPGVRVKLVGDGEWRGRLEAQARAAGVADRVAFVGRLPHERLHVAYSAADALSLLSSREGWPNVLLESLASGTPVAATRVFGTPEVVRDDAVGVLVGA